MGEIRDTKNATSLQGLEKEVVDHFRDEGLDHGCIEESVGNPMRRDHQIDVYLEEKVDQLSREGSSSYVDEEIDPADAGEGRIQLENRGALNIATESDELPSIEGTNAEVEINTYKDALEVEDDIAVDFDDKVVVAALDKGAEGELLPNSQGRLVQIKLRHAEEKHEENPSLQPELSIPLQTMEDADLHLEPAELGQDSIFSCKSEVGEEMSEAGESLMMENNLGLDATCSSGLFILTGDQGNQLMQAFNCPLGEEISFQCDSCLASFETNTELLVHLRECRKEAKYKCTVCRKSFGSQALLEAHTKIHGIAKRFECHLCSKTFSTNKILKRHMRWVSNKPTMAV